MINKDDKSKNLNLIKELKRKEDIIINNFRKEFPELYNILLRLDKSGYYNIFRYIIINLDIEFNYIDKSLGHNKDIINKFNHCVDYIINYEEQNKSKNKNHVFVINIDDDKNNVHVIDDLYHKSHNKVMFTAE